MGEEAFQDPAMVYGTIFPKQPFAKFVSVALGGCKIQRCARFWIT
jgi:hypothetical protein